MSDAVLKEISATLRELLKWTKFAGMQQLRNVLSQTLKTETEMLVYELSDGTRGTREVATAVRISHTTVASSWKKWNKVGIVEPSPTYQGRFQRICSLEEVGLEVPTMPQQIEAPPNEKMGVKQDE
jgi:predicted transcriptional regulator